MDPVRLFDAQILILKLFVEESESYQNFVFEIAAIFSVTILVVWQYRNVINDFFRREVKAKTCHLLDKESVILNIC